MRHTLSGPDRATRGAPKPTLEQRFADEARFIRAWLDNPIATGAVYPSGKVLSRTMALAVDPSVPGAVVELGPGTGPVTEALIRRGVVEDRLVLVEFDPDFCKLLRRRYPKATVVEGDAYALSMSLRPVLTGKAAAIVSSLPLLTKPDRQRLALLAEAFDLMESEGVFVQFTYGLGSPVPRVNENFEPAGFRAKVSPPVWLNFPPARVWTYRATCVDSNEGAAVRRPFIVKFKNGTDKIGDELRDARERVRRAFVIRAEKAKTELRLRAERRTASKIDLASPEAKRPGYGALQRRSDKRPPHW